MHEAEGIVFRSALIATASPISLGQHAGGPQLADYDAFPELASLPGPESRPGAGSMLYVPPRWWHYVKALAMSFSIGSWWQ